MVQITEYARDIVTIQIAGYSYDSGYRGLHVTAVTDIMETSDGVDTIGHVVVARY